MIIFLPQVIIPLFISGAEMVFIGFILVMVFGADKIPNIARTLGKSIRQVRDVTDDIKREISKSATDVTSNLEDLDPNKDLKQGLDEFKDDIDKLSGPISRRKL